jgi:hypothetical protein
MRAALRDVGITSGGGGSVRTRNNDIEGYYHVCGLESSLDSQVVTPLLL